MVTGPLGTAGVSSLASMAYLVLSVINRCGKTTLAKLIADKSDAIFKELSATSSGVNEVKAVVEEAKKTQALVGR